MSGVSAAEIEQHILKNYRHINAVGAWGERAFFVNPDSILPRGAYFATLKFNDGENDRASNINRPNVFRFNIGLAKEDYALLFGAPPKRPAKGGVAAGEWNFTKLNILTPHPVYGWMQWAAVLNPDKNMFRKCLPLLDGAYKKALSSTQKNIARLGSI